MGSKRDAFEKKYGGGAPAATAVAPQTEAPKPAGSKRAAFEAKYGAANPSQATPSPASPEPVSEFLPQMRMPEMPQPYEYTPGPGSVRALEVQQEENSRFVDTPLGPVALPKAPAAPAPAPYTPDPRLVRSERLMGEVPPQQPATPAPLPPEAIPADYQHPYDARRIVQDLSDFVVPPQAMGAAKLGIGVAGAALAGINNQLRQGENDALKSERAGYGDAVAGLGSAAQYAGDPALAGGLKIAGAAMQQAAEGVQVPEYQGLSSLADPQYLATRGVRTVAGSVPLMAAGMGVGGAATAAAGPLVGSLIGAAVSRPIESATEAGQTYEDALKQGMSEADARSAANRTFWLNNALVVTDAGELFTALAPLPDPLRKILGVGTKESVSAMQRVAMGLLKTGLTAGQEGLEEGAQTAIQRTSLGKPVEWDKEMQESILLGGAMGGLMGAGGAVMEGGQAGPKPAPTPAQPAPVVEQPKAQTPGQTPGQIAPVESPGTVAPPAVEAGQISGQEQGQNPDKAGQVDRTALLRQANPGMDEKAILDMVKTTGSLSDEEFRGFAERAGKAEAATAPNTPPSPQEPVGGPALPVATAPLPSGREGDGASQAGRGEPKTETTNPEIAALADDALLERMETLRKTKGDIEEHKTVHREAARRGLVAKIPADLSDADQARHEAALADIGKTRRLVEELEGMSEDDNYSPAWRADKRRKLVEARVASERAEQTVKTLERELGLYRKTPTTPTTPQGDTTPRPRGQTPVPAAAGKQTPPPRKDPSGIAGSTFKHFTTPEGKAALESGQPFDFTKEPQHGTGDFSKGPKAGKMAGNRLYLSLDDGRWGTVEKETGKGQTVEATEANEKKYGDKAKAFYDYDKQKWMLNVGGHEKVDLNPVEYQIAPDARVLVIDSEQKLLAAAAEASTLAKKKVYTQGDDMLWDALAKKYDVIAIRNVKKITEATDNKFFRAAGSDQLIVLNPAVATVKTAQKAGPTSQGNPAEEVTNAFHAIRENPDDQQAWERIINGADPDVKPLFESVRGMPEGNHKYTAFKWLAGVTELDRMGADRAIKAESEYRLILSTGSKDPLKRGETWRERVLGYAKSAIAKGKQETETDPNAWKSLIMNPADPQGLAALETLFTEAGKTVPQKIRDLLSEQTILLERRPTEETRAVMGRVARELEEAVTNGLKPEQKTAIERVLNGEEATPLTGKPLPPGALEGKVKSTSSPAEAASSAGSQQASLFDQVDNPPLSAEQQDQLAAYQAELGEVQESHRAARVKWDAAVEEVATKLAKDATQENEKVRKELWNRIKERGYIGPSKTGNEDFYGRLSNKVSHLKRKTGVPLDILATDLGYESEDALVNDINGMAEVGKVSQQAKWSEAEHLYEGSAEGGPLKAELDYYRQAEADVQEAIGKLEGGNRGGEGETQADQRLNAEASAGQTTVTGGVRAAVSEAGAGRGARGEGRSGAEAGEAALSDTDRAVDDVQAMALPGQILGSTPPAASKGKVQRIEIVRHFAKGLGIPIRTGRFMAKALGIFKVRSEAIRTKLAEDLRTITHEVGHFLDKRLSLADPQFDAELIPLGQPTSRATYTRAQVRAEGVAEFMNLYLTDKAQAQNQAPGFFAHFERALAADKKLRRVIAEGQDMLHVYVSQNATDMVKSGISYTPPKEGWTWERLKQIGLNLYEAWTDKHDPLMVAEKRMNKGQRVSNRLSPFAQATLARGWEGLAKKFLETGAQRYNHTTQRYETVGPSLNAILEPIGDKLDDFAAYSAAMRALYLAKTRGWDDTKLPFPLWAARDTVRQYSSPEFAKALKELQTFQDAVLDHYAEAGFLTKQQLAQIRAANKVYVPYLREQVEEGPGMRQILGPKYANVSNAVMKMKGGTGTVINPLHSIVHNTFKLINLAERNKTGVLLADLADRADGAGNVIEDVTKSFKPATFSLEQIKDVLNAELAASGEDVDTLGMDMSAMATVFSPNTMPTGGDAAKGIFSVYRNGKTKFYQADPSLYRALTAMDKPALNAFFKALSYHTQLKRTFAVVTPEFIMRNFGRDALTSGVYGRGLPLEAHMRGFVAQIFNKEAVTRWEAGGGFASSMVSADRDYQAETIRGLVAKHKLLKENLLPPWRALQNLSEFIERAPKVGEMLMAEEGSALEHKLFGLGKGAVDTRSGILESKDLNLDFGRSGNLGQQWNSITAFFNAWMQDTDKFVRAHTNPKTAARVITRGVMFITMPTFLLWLRNKDDEEYKEFPQWRKDLFWNFKIGDRWYWWPAPHMLALAYKAIPERIFNAIHQGSSKAFTKDFAETAETLSGPNTIPDSLALMAELKFNWNFFGDRPTVPRGEERKEPAQQAGPYTSESAKRVGAAIEVSPRKVEQAVRGMLAGGGGYLLAGADKALEVYDRATGKPLPPAKSARESTFVRAFSSKNPLASGAQSIDDFYRSKEKHDTLWASLPGRAGISKPLGDYATWKTEEKVAFKQVVASLSEEERELIGPDFNKWRLVGKTKLNKVEKQLGDLSKLKLVIERSSATAEKKRRDIDTLERQRLNLARGALGKPKMPQ